MERRRDWSECAVVLLICRRKAEIRRERVSIVGIAPEYDRLVRHAQPSGGDHQGIEYRLQIEFRLADDLQHVADRGLVFERFLQVARAVAQFVEQPRVLHRDDRLRREAL